MTNKENNFISAVVYIRNVEGSIESFLKKIEELFYATFEKYELIFVNDHSDDSSAQKIRQWAEGVSNGAIELINTGFYQGLESSMLAGIDLASGDFVFEFDDIVADYSKDTIMAVYNHCLEGNDIVGATPSVYNLRSSRLFYSVYNRYAKTQYKLQTESFRLLSRRAINRVNQLNIAIPYRKAIYANCGLKYGNVRYQSKSEPNYPTDKTKGRYRQGVAIDSLIIFTNIAYRFALTLTFIMMAVSVIAAVYSVVIYVQNRPIAGWTTTMLMLSFGFFGIFGLFSITIKYLSVIINLVFKKSKYMIEEIEKL